MGKVVEKPPHSRAAIYARVSSEEQVQGYSIKAQLRACHEWAAKNGCKVVREYVDEGYSASRHPEKREGFKEMLSDAASKDHPFELIIVHKLDRFSRDSLESLTSRAILKRHRVRLVSVQEPMVGSDSPEDAFMEHILVAMAEFYSRNLAREIRKGLTERVRQGFLVFRPPYGYMREVIEKRESQKRTRTISRPVIDPRAAPIVRWIFELFDKGLGYRNIVHSLNSGGYRTNEGHEFRVYLVSRILRNKAYIGILEYNFRQDRGPREPAIIPGFYPPIVDDNLFNRVQEKLKETAAYWQDAYVHRSNYLLSRLVVCGACAHRYVGTAAKSSQFHYYTCQTRLQKGAKACSSPLLNKQKLETAVLEQIQNHILTEENVRRYIELVIEHVQNSGRKPNPEEKAVLLAIEDVDARLDRWEEALEKGHLSLGECAHKIRELRSQREALLNRKAELERKSRSTAQIRPIPTALMDAYVREMQARLRAKQIGYKKEFLREILKEVRVRGREITLTYRLPLKVESAPLDTGKAPKERFFTLSQMVVAAGLEPATSRM